MSLWKIWSKKPGKQAQEGSLPIFPLENDCGDKLEALDARIGEHGTIDNSQDRIPKPRSAAEYRAAAQTPYKYRPLPPPSGDIFYLRLLEIRESRSIDAPLECSIRHYGFDSTDQQTYHAVSYVWGPPEFSELLICDDCTSHLRITPRLHDILIRLRKRSYTNLLYAESSTAGFGTNMIMRVWIDAICINQNDPIERSQQIQQMAKIYRRAMVVHVFLSDRKGTTSWLESNWFTRRWVVQELLSASKVHAHLPQASDKPKRQQIAEVSWNWLMDELQKEPIISELTRLNPNVRDSITEFRRLKGRGLKYFNILTILLKFQYADCDDDRDRIFAFIGIASDVLPPENKPPENTATTSHDKLVLAHYRSAIKFSPDYSISTDHTYINFAKAALQCAFPFDILHCAGAIRRLRPGRILVQETSLPSWVPDWRLKTLYKPLMRATVFDSGGYKKRDSILITITEVKLEIKGWQISTVDSVGKTFPASESDWKAYVKDSFDDPSYLDLSLDRVCIRTSDGLVGAAPPDAEAGDEIVIFVASRTPFILRRIGDSNEYCLIGDCYVEGIMHGEVLRDSSHEKSDFVIV